MLVKILGVIDLMSAFIFLMFIFGFDVNVRIILFCAALLFMKGLFIFAGDVLSGIDIFSSMVLIISIFFAVPSLLFWIPAFFLLAKGVVSFL